MNIAEDRSHFTAEAWLVWTTLLAPELLQGRLETRFYNHTLQLVDLIRRTMSFDYTYEELRELRNRWAEWVQNYERYYYCYDEERLSACPLTIHALLHIIDGIFDAGPVAASRLFPYASLNRHILALEQIAVIKTRYNLYQRLDRLKAMRPPSHGFRLPAYPHAILLPARKKIKLEAHLFRCVVAHLATRFDTSANQIRTLVPQEMDSWARVQQDGGGDLMRAAKASKPQTTIAG
ncbi:hypothetical protein M422DRAFT_272282 [Sphaerobolus stellatus SS14]|uniref:Uncharacterized protein n=1 Tax=Sphaerobolus stellatus (strain SS14) TaxID=990650 RepID=A0A0C9UMX6_SPHS4|nr:hypothetical protein M422DRAFT_272282 [Sphaerobolus stellatus SS14]